MCQMDIFGLNKCCIVGLIVVYLVVLANKRFEDSKQCGYEDRLNKTSWSIGGPWTKDWHGSWTADMGSDVGSERLTYRFWTTHKSTPTSSGTSVT